MKNKSRKRIIRSDKDFTLDGNHLQPYYKMLFRFVRMDNSMPVLRKVEITPELFMGLWGFERHLLKIIKIQDSLSTGQPINWEQVERGIWYPKALLRTAYQVLKEKYETERPVLNEEFLREVHDSICSAFHIIYSNPREESVSKSADGIYNRGNQRIFQKKYEEALADFTRANELEPNNHLFELALAQFWLRYGGDNQRACVWIDLAILHIGNNSPLEQAYYHLLRATILCGLKRYEEATRSFQICTGALSFIIERLDWKNGEASLGEGITIYAEGVRDNLSEAIEATAHLLTLVNGGLANQLQSILRVQKQLWKLL
jgi:tetratricopeptide (TPR) repeat protein